MQKTDRRIAKINKILSVLLCAAVLNLVLLFFGINIPKSIKNVVTSEEAVGVYNKVFSAVKQSGEYLIDTFMEREDAEESSSEI